MNSEIISYKLEQLKIKADVIGFDKKFLTAEIEHLITEIEKALNIEKIIEKGGNSNHPLGLNPSIRTTTLFHLIRCDAILDQINESKNNHPIINIPEILYPKVRLVLFQKFITYFLIVKAVFNHNKKLPLRIKIWSTLYLKIPIGVPEALGTIRYYLSHIFYRI